MNILNISTQDAPGGGSAAARLNKNFKNYGYNSKLLVLDKYSDDEDIIQIRNKFSYFTTRVKNKILRTINLSYKIPSNPKYSFNNYNEKKVYYSTKYILKKVTFKPDIIILHWIAQFINSKNIFELNYLTGAPILWYLMDMAALTGGCHYSWGCNGYKNSCGECPALNTSNTFDISYNNLMEKHKNLNKTNLSVIVPTSWLENQAKESMLFKEKNIYKILLGIDDRIFKPIDEKLAKNKLNLKLNNKIIFIGAKFRSNPLLSIRKGFSYLLEALKHLKRLISNTKIESNVFLLIAGNLPDVLLSEIPFDFKYIGLLKNDQELSLAYQAADIFVCPSIEDSGPMMINESIMCGTPVVSFEMGVAPDLVHTGITGYRAKFKDSEDFANGIFEILNLNNTDYNKMSNNCRKLGLKMLQPNVQVEQFKKIFKMTSSGEKVNNKL